MYFSFKIDRFLYIYKIIHQKLAMAKITCMDYGFDCSYVAEGEVEHVISQYQKHSTDEHGIEYSAEALTQVILRQQG